MYTKEEQAANRAKLVEALRSGEYKQTSGALCHERSDGGFEYCCLGVACKISELGEFDYEGDDVNTPFRVKGVPHRVYRTMLPVEVMDWLGFDTGNGKLTIQAVDALENLTEDSLAGLNDDGWTFEELAYLIEKGMVATV